MFLVLSYCPIALSLANLGDAVIRRSNSYIIGVTGRTLCAQPPTTSTPLTTPFCLSVHYQQLRPTVQPLEYDQIYLMLRSSSKSSEWVIEMVEAGKCHFRQ